MNILVNKLKLEIFNIYQVIFNINNIFNYTADVVAVLSARAASVGDSWAVQAPELRSKPEFHTSHAELFVLKHFCQFDGVQFRIVSFIIFWAEPEALLITELI